MPLYYDSVTASLSKLTLNTSINISASSYITGLLLLPTTTLIYRISCHASVRLRLYTSVAARNADINRAPTTTPSGNHGLLFQGKFSDLVDVLDLSPAIIASSLESSGLAFTANNLTANSLNSLNLGISYSQIN